MYGAENVVAEGQLTYGTQRPFWHWRTSIHDRQAQQRTEGYTFYRRSFESGEQDLSEDLETDEQWAFQMLESSARVDFDKREGVIR